MTDRAETKAQLRQRLRFRRASHVAAMAPWERSIVFAHPPSPLLDLLGDRTVVAIHAAHGDEPDIARIGAALVDAGHRLAMPRLGDSAGTMDFAAYAPGDALEPTRYGLAHPAADAAKLAPDAILCPLIGFDRAMHRLGQGGGYYDRAFAAHPDAIRIGIGWSVQECQALPHEDHDMPLDAVLTEREWIVAS